MAGTTTELSLATAVDTDDTADYLTLNLANSLRTIDALFNNITGHTHASAHQGGPIAASSLRGGMDLPDWFRSTGHTSAFSGTGIGIEMYWAGTTGILQSFNRATAAYAEVDIYGTKIVLGINGGASLVVNTDQSVAIAGALTVTGQTVHTGAVSANGGLAVTGNATVTGAVTAAGLTSTAGANITGALSVSGAISGGSSIASTTRIQSGADVMAGNGVLYLGTQGDTVIQRQAAAAVLMPTTVYFGVADTWLARNGAQAGQIDINDRLSFLKNAGGGPGQVLWPDGASIANGVGVGKSQTVYMAPHAYVFFDLGVGHTVTCQSLVQTSDPNLKSNMTVMPDATCMDRIRNTAVQVYTYQLTPPDGDNPDGPIPTPTDIGFDATQVYAASPEFAALDDLGNAVGVSYPNMAAMLWGALRELDARCTAKGI